MQGEVSVLYDVYLNVSLSQINIGNNMISNAI